MLVLTRGVGEAIVVDGRTKITINEIRDGRIRLGIEAPDDVVIDRLEVHESKQRDKQEGRPWPRVTLFDSIDSLMAHDCRSSGPDDPELKAAVRKRLNGLDDDERRKTLDRFAARYFTDEAIDGGYGIGAVKELIDWLEAVGVED